MSRSHPRHKYIHSELRSGSFVKVKSAVLQCHAFLFSIHKSSVFNVFSSIVWQPQLHKALPNFTVIQTCNINPFPMTPFDRSGKTPFQSIVGKGENAGDQHFLLFPQCFLLYQRQKLLFKLHSFCRLQMLSIWTKSNFCRLGMG